jgi:hypothetical protein
VAADPTAASFRISPGASSVDTNCTGCNATTAQGAPVQQFQAQQFQAQQFQAQPFQARQFGAEQGKSAALADGTPAQIIWSVSGGDPNSGPGSISASGQYTPPSYLTVDRAQVVVTAMLNGALNGAGTTGTVTNGTATATSVITVTPGFLQPLTPENAAVGAGGQLTVTGFLAEAGGEDSIGYALAGAPTGSGGAGIAGHAQLPAHGTCLHLPARSRTRRQPSCTATGATYMVATAGLRVEDRRRSAGQYGRRRQHPGLAPGRSSSAPL